MDVVDRVRLGEHRARVAASLDKLNGFVGCTTADLKAHPGGAELLALDPDLLVSVALVTIAGLRGWPTAPGEWAAEQEVDSLLGHTLLDALRRRRLPWRPDEAELALRAAMDGFDPGSAGVRARCGAHRSAGGARGQPTVRRADRGGARAAAGGRPHLPDPRAASAGARPSGRTGSRWPPRHLGAADDRRLGRARAGGIRPGRRRRAGAGGPAGRADPGAWVEAESIMGAGSRNPRRSVVRGRRAAPGPPCTDTGAGPDTGSSCGRERHGLAEHVAGHAGQRCRPPRCGLGDPLGRRRLGARSARSLVTAGRCPAPQRYVTTALCAPLASGALEALSRRHAAGDARATAQLRLLREEITRRDLLKRVNTVLDVPPDTAAAQDAALARAKRQEQARKANPLPKLQRTDLLRLVRRDLAPVLRDAGFDGTAATFVRTASDHQACVQFGVNDGRAKVRLGVRYGAFAPDDRPASHELDVTAYLVSGAVGPERWTWDVGLGLGGDDEAAARLCQALVTRGLLWLAAPSGDAV